MGGVDFEIGISRLGELKKKFYAKLVYFLLFFGGKKFLKALLTCIFILYYWILLIYLATGQNRGKDTITDVSREGEGELWKSLCQGRSKWDKVFKNGPSKICRGQPLKNLKEYGLPKADHAPKNCLKSVFHKSYLVHSWILCPKWLAWEEGFVWD